MRRLLTAGFAFALLAPACTDNNPCDATTYFVDRTCRPIPPDAAPFDVAPPDRNLTGPVNFGATCKDHPDCMGPSSACLIQPGQTMGFCSAVECDKMPGICPMNWTCCDLSRIRPGSPWGCIPLAVCP
jgi:hypothetical protein